MKTWICTNIANFYGPFQGAARLYAYVRKQGHDVCLKDLNQDAYFSLLSREYLEPTLEKTQWVIDSVARNSFLREDLGSIILHSSNNAIKQLLAKGILLNSPWYKYIKNAGLLRNPLLDFASSRVKASNVLYALLSEKEYVLGEIERSRQALDKEFFGLSPDKFVENFNMLLCGKAMIDAAYFPTQMDFGLGFYGTEYSPRTGDILRAVGDEKHNFLLPYFRKEILPALNAEHPEVVGISATCLFELLPAFTLAHCIKTAAPQTHIVLGGVLITELAQRIVKNTPLWDMFDSLILGPGERAFSDLIEHVEKKADLSKVPNIIYKDGANIKQGDKIDEFDINEACTPEFVSLRPKSGLPLETTSSCYWGRCIFCYYPKTGTVGMDASNARKRVRKIELVLKDIRQMKEMYDPLAIGFTDSSLHPKRMEAIVEDNVRSEKKVKFFALFRMEKEFKSKAFCRKLLDGGFMGGSSGLESGSQRVNDIINKGVDLKDAAVIINNFYETGLLLHIYSIVGIPGETGEDAMMTYDFLKRMHRRLTLDWQVYPLYVLEQSPISHRAAEFGVEVTPASDDYLVEAMFYKVGKGLSQEESMSLSISYTEKLRRYMHPLNQIMDIESLKLFLLAQMAKGVPPHKVRNKGIGI